MFDEKGNFSGAAKALIAIGVIFVVIILLGACSMTTIPAGRVGVITRMGAVNRVVEPGLSWRIPLIEGATKMDTRTLKDQVDASAASKDLQVVTSTIAVNYHLDGKFAADIYQSVGMGYADILIAPAIQNTFKATTAGFTAEQLITQREAVRIAAEKALTDQLSQYHIIVENFNIVNFDFSKEFNDAIEAKQVANQQVETAKQQLLRTQVEAQTALAQAEGQANAQSALQKTGALSDAYLRYLALTKWNGILPNVVGGAIPFIDVSTQGVPPVSLTK